MTNKRNFGTKALRRDGVRYDTQGGRAFTTRPSGHAKACEAAVRCAINHRVARQDRSLYAVLQRTNRMIHEFMMDCINRYQEIKYLAGYVEKWCSGATYELAPLLKRISTYCRLHANRRFTL
ncbi:MAG TPA: hypothetical protein VNX00_13370 [Herbaspirillum sp.]|jgi:hypothetical protein|nr:hypothetical protein [Herbaspirillum sp.]